MTGDEIPPELRSMVAETRRLKNKVVRLGEPDGMGHIIEFGRDGRRIIRALVTNAETLLDIIASTIPVTAADWLSVGMDAYRYSRATVDAADTNPITGKPWRLGDMARIAQMDAGVERGIIGESLHFIHATRDGRFVGGDLSYRLEAGRLIYGSFLTWDFLDLRDRFGDRMKTPRFPRVIDEAFAAETLFDIVPPEEHGATRRAALKVAIQATAEHIDGLDHAVLLEAKW